eukprot:gene6185-10194_t
MSTKQIEINVKNIKGRITSLTIKNTEPFKYSLKDFISDQGEVRLYCSKNELDIEKTPKTYKLKQDDTIEMKLVIEFHIFYQEKITPKVVSLLLRGGTHEKFKRCKMPCAMYETLMDCMKRQPLQSHVLPKKLDNLDASSKIEDLLDDFQNPSIILLYKKGGEKRKKIDEDKMEEDKMEEEKEEVIQELPVQKNTGGTMNTIIGNSIGNEIVQNKSLYSIKQQNIKKQIASINQQNITQPSRPEKMLFSSSNKCYRIKVLDEDFVKVVEPREPTMEALKQSIKETFQHLSWVQQEKFKIILGDMEIENDAGLTYTERNSTLEVMNTDHLEQKIFPKSEESLWKKQKLEINEHPETSKTETEELRRQELIKELREKIKIEKSPENIEEMEIWCYV